MHSIVYDPVTHDYDYRKDLPVNNVRAVAQVHVPLSWRNAIPVMVPNTADIGLSSFGEGGGCARLAAVLMALSDTDGLSCSFYVSFPCWPFLAPYRQTSIINRYVPTPLSPLSLSHPQPTPPVSIGA